MPLFYSLFENLSIFFLISVTDVQIYLNLVIVVEYSNFETVAILWQRMLNIWERYLAGNNNLASCDIINYNSDCLEDSFICGKWIGMVVDKSTIYYTNLFKLQELTSVAEKLRKNNEKNRVVAGGREAYRQ